MDGRCLRKRHAWLNIKTSLLLWNIKYGIHMKAFHVGIFKEFVLNVLSGH